MAKILIYRVLKELKILKDLNAVVFPVCCVCCGNTLFRHEKEICNYCLHHLPVNNSFGSENNRVKRLFEGRVKIKKAAALYNFIPRGKIQRLTHALKYQNRTEIAEVIGFEMAKKMRQYDFWLSHDLIIPVPLHPLKYKKRGYNQSELLADAVSKHTSIPLRNDALIRRYNTSSQTRKSRWERWQNMEDKFEPGIFSVKDLNILLIDDIITTGATAEACAHTLLNNGAASVSIASIAIADKTKTW